MTRIVVQTTPLTGPAAKLALKSFLKTTIGWTVPKSGDATSYNASADIITHAGSGVGGWGNTGAHAVLQDPAGVNQISIQRGSGNTLWRAKWSPAAKFNGGSPDATHVPSATDEAVIFGSGSDASPTGNAWFAADGTYRYIMSADNAAPYGFWVIGFPSGGGAPTHQFIYDPVNVDVATDGNKIVIATAQANAWTNLALSMDTNQSNVLRVMATPPALVPGTPVAVAAAVYLIQNGGTSGIACPHNIGTNPIANKDQRLPIAYMRRVAVGGTPFHKGTSTQIRWNGMSRTMGDRMTVAVAGDRLVVGECSVEWDGSVVVI